MKRFFFGVAVLAAVGCGAIHDADRQVNKMTDHGSSRDPNVQTDDGASGASSRDAGTEAGVISM